MPEIFIVMVETDQHVRYAVGAFRFRPDAEERVSILNQTFEITGSDNSSYIVAVPFLG